jgi:defect-in-organelle-trafficking protein DotC
MIKKTVSALVLSTLFSVNSYANNIGAGSHSANEKQENTSYSVDDKLIEKEASSQELDHLRLKSIRDAVYTVSLQTAVNDEYNKIEQQLEDDEFLVSEVFNFMTPFLLSEGKLMPPIISEAQDSLNIVSNTEASASLTTFTIERDARIVSRGLSWRDYLIIEDFPVQKISPLLKPKTEEEAQAWREAQQEGERDGKEQAYLLYTDNVARLTRDVAGSIRFHRLMKQNIITKPILAKGKTLSSVNGKTLSVGNTLYKLTEHAIYEDESKWKVKSSHMNR